MAREYYRLIWISHEKRHALEELSKSKLQLNHKMTLTAGILSLLSALSLSAVVVANVSPNLLSFAALSLAFTGGVIALISSFKYNFRELLNLHLGASKFLELREQATGIACDRRLCYKTRKQRLTEYWKKYAEVSQMYDHYVKVGEPPTSPTYQTGSEIAASHVGQDRVKEFHQKLFDEQRVFLERISEKYNI